MGYYNKLALDAPVYVNVHNGAAAAAQIDGYIFVSDGYYEVEFAGCSHDVAGGSGALVDVKKVPSGTTIGSGVSVLATTFDLTATADVSQVRSIQAGTMTATSANRSLVPGDSLALDFAGTLTGLAGVGLTIRLRRTRQNF